MAAVIRSTQVLSISTGSAKFTSAMAIGQRYLLTSDTDCWFKQDATGGSATAATANNMFLKAGAYIELETDDATNNGFVHVITAAGSGTAVLALLE